MVKVNEKQIETTHFLRYSIKNNIEIEMMESFMEEAVYN
jgi:hypothetical protein